MGTLDDILADDAAYMTDTDEFGETVTYTPAGGSGVEYSAVVHRAPLEVQDEGAVAESFTVFLRYDSAGTNGPASIDIGGDAIALKKRIGDASNTTYSIRHITNQDNGGWVLLVY